MNPAQINTLRDSLPAFGEPFADPALLNEYCRYYSLDFCDCIEGVKHRLGTISSGPYQLATHYWECTGARSNLLLNDR